MGELSYKQLHQFSCGKLTIPERNSLVSSCSHGCFVCVSDQCLFLYDTESYLEATRLCELRRDKPLSDHKPNITVSSVDPIIWTAFNSDGLTLSVITSSESRGTFVNLVNVIDLVKRGSTDLQNISRSVRVCGGENDLWKLRDFAWSPTDPTTFVVVLDSGVVRLFSFLTDGNGSVTLVGQLPMTANCRCVSWSPKGKQLAICLTGSLSTPNGLAQGPLILQVDPQLQQKRIVPLGHLFESNHEWNNSLPFDLLWTSSYTFLLAIKQSTNEPQLTCSTHVLYISTTSKSPEPSAVAVDGLSSQMNCDHLQYYFRFLGPNHVVVTWAYVGEEVLVLQLPPNASGNSPQVVMSVELPPDGCAVSMDVGVFRKDNESAENSLVYMIAYLSNGNVCPYLLNSNDLLTLLNPNPPKLVSLLIPKPSVPSADKTIISNSPKPTFVPSSSYSNGMPVVNQAKPSIVSSVDSNHTTQFLPINGITVCMNSFTISTESNTTSLQNNTTVNRSFSNLDNMPTKTISENKEYCVDKSKLTDSRDIPLPKSVQVAAAHFTSALQSEAKSGRLAWRNLFNILISGDIEGKSDKSIGLDIIEARLFDVLIELTNAVTERKEDLTNSVNFGERLRRALRLYATSDWFHTLSGHLDPETNRLFSQVKRRARLAEAGLYDLENQIESLSSEINTVSSKNVTTILPSPIASNTIVSVTPKTSPKPIEKNVDDIKRSGDSPLVSSNLSFKTSASVISKPDMGSDIKESQIVDCSTASSVHPMPILNDNDRYKANATHQQSLPFGTNLFGTSSFKPQLSTAPSIVTTSVLTSTPFVINNAGVISVPTSQKIEPSLTNSTTSVTMNRTHLVNSNQVMSTNSLINAPVIPKPIDSVNGSERETNEIKKENLIPDISSVNSPQTTIVTSKSSGLFSFLPTPVCSSSTMFGSKQDQNATSTTAAFSSASNSLFTGIPLATCTTTADSNSTTKSTAAFNYKPLFGPPISISATTTSPTSIAGDNLFLFGTLSQSPIVSKSPTTTFIPTSPIVCQTGTPLSKSEGLTTLFGSTTSTTPVALPFSGTTFAASLSTLRGGSASTTSISTPSLFDTPVFSKSTTMSSGGLFGTNVSSFQTTTSTQVPVAGLFSFLNTATTSSSFTNTTTVVTTGSTTTTSVTPSFSGLFSSSIFVSGSKLFQTNATNLVTTTSAPPLSTTFGGLLNASSVTSTNNNTTVSAMAAQTTNANNLFNFSSGASSSLFGSSTINHGNSTPGTGLFGTVSNAQQVTSNPTAATPAASSNLFGSPLRSDTKCLDSLFSSSSLNLGGNSTNQNSTQNVFGKPFGNTAFGNQTNSTLFGSPTSVPKTNAAISASSPPSGLFGNSILGSSLFTSPTTATAVSSSGGGLFSNIETNVNSGTGLFGAQSSGGFGSSPIFGSPAFNKPVNNPSPIGQGLFGMSGPAAFNSSGGGLFGSVGSNPVAVGGSLFGSGSNPPAGGGLFASLGNKTDNLSFGSLAQNSPPGIGNIPVSPFADYYLIRTTLNYTKLFHFYSSLLKLIKYHTIIYILGEFFTLPINTKATAPVAKIQRGGGAIKKCNQNTGNKHDGFRSKTVVGSPLDLQLIRRHMSISQPPVGTPANFYSKAKCYWSQVPATVDGMLSGYTSLNVPDIADSDMFLDEFGPSTTAYALDCGSGIGRVTKQLLLPRFSIVDMVELTQSFLDQTENYIGPDDFPRVGERFCMGLQDFTPPAGRYDLIWIQWVLGHLSDLALLAFLKRCAHGLSAGGVIVIKENITSPGGHDEQSIMNSEEIDFDETDSSYTRPRSAYIRAFLDTNLKLIGEKAQTNFPSSLYPVRMFALCYDVEQKTSPT
ncbi:Alpha N-terminal protein methyltransferase 1 [Schistosoma japonicum]|nr:Alpha N-terminal protein methyltransferase 1 [Schistosoma japonicum]